jgi:hypothetical protein
MTGAVMRRALPLLLALAACDPNPSFVEPVAHPRAAFMSVGGTGPEDVWVVGAQPDPLAPATVLRRRDGAWTPIETGTLHPIWWVHAFDGGPTFLGGGGATVLRVDGDVVSRTPTPPFFGNTVFGVWGASPDDVWAVGGFAGRAGFIWRYDGATWTSVDLPDDLPRTADGELPSLFKVWGRSSDDVWVVGGLGTVLHFDGSDWEIVPSDTTRPLFTITGNDDEVFIVGGDSRGVVLRGDRSGLVDDTPPGAPLLQGATVDRKGRAWIAGANGYAARQKGGGWREVDLGLTEQPQSVHALWSDGEGAIWGAGGGVLSATLDEGVVCASDADDATWAPPPTPDPPTTCPPDRVDPAPDGSMARRWSELLLDSIRRDFPHPPKHARNIHHVTAAMYDAWAVYQDGPAQLVVDEKRIASSPSDVDTAIAYAALRVLEHRYATAVGSAVSLDCYDRFMDRIGLDPDDLRADGDDPVSVGNRVGLAYIAAFADDGANEAGDLADTTGWTPANPVMFVDRPGTNVIDPDIWQQLNLGVAETQNGIILDDSVQPYIAPHWREVTPFALVPDPETGLLSPVFGEPPTIADPEIVAQAVQVVAKTAELDIDDGVEIDVGPAGRGNNPLGADTGTGYDLNPITGRPYEPNLALRGDFTRVVAEVWADGPQSETPPGHWLRLGNEVSDAIAAEDRRPFGEGAPVDRLAWDVGLYLAIGGAVHDAAISAWELKRDTLGARPITLIRWMGQQGQRTDPDLPSYHPDGLPLVPGLIEVITPESSAPGERHRHLKHYVGEIAVWSWPGEPGDRVNDYTPLTWMRAKDWIPYQRRTFVTPAFPGYTSGHSTFSRAAAEAMAAYTGSPYFPGGLWSWTAPRNGYLKFEAGPSQDLTLQWATYADAADQSGQSRLWGGIHIFADDRYGRINGYHVGRQAADRARALWTGAEDGT